MPAAKKTARTPARSTAKRQKSGAASGVKSKKGTARRSPAEEKSLLRGILGAFVDGYAGRGRATSKATKK